MKNLLLTGGAIGGIIAGAVVGVLLIIFIAWYISTHNKFVTLQSNNEEAFSTIDVYLKKRYDLIPNLVETVKGYAKHESETLEKVIAARSMAMSATTLNEKAEADKVFTQAVRSFNRVVERYPELKANTNFMSLQNQLQSIEGELSQARKYYNATTKQYNIKIKTFPSSIVANRMKLEKAPYFEVSAPEERENVKVSF